MFAATGLAAEEDNTQVRIIVGATVATFILCGAVVCAVLLLVRRSVLLDYPEYGVFCSIIYAELIF